MTVGEGVGSARLSALRTHPPLEIQPVSGRGCLDRKTSLGGAASLAFTACDGPAGVALSLLWLCPVAFFAGMVIAGGAFSYAGHVVRQFISGHQQSVGRWFVLIPFAALLVFVALYSWGFGLLVDWYGTGKVWLWGAYWLGFLAAAGWHCICGWLFVRAGTGR